jgi:tRNA(Ile2) C34 agmatinyltransferase TiaS
MPKTQVVRVPSELVEQVELAKAKIIMNRNVLKKLPDNLTAPSKCPVCNGPMEKTAIKVDIGTYKCSSCGYKQPYINAEVFGNDLSSLAAALGLGVLAGLGIALLLNILFGGEK